MATTVSKHFSPALAKSTDLILERGEGPYVFTVDGKRYLDMVQGIAVNALGHCHPALVEAACKQINTLGHASFNLASFPSTLALGEELSKFTPGDLDMFMLANSGAEAVDCALKLARYLTRRSCFVAFRGGFHGRTFGATSVTSSKASFRQNYAPWTPHVHFAFYPYCYRCPFHQKNDSCNLDCLQCLEQDLHYSLPAQDVAAVIFELVQGEGGYIVPPKRYVKALRELCNKHGWLFIADEIQTGIGRTGKMFACEHFGLVPDIMCLGKALGGGFPLSAVAASPDLLGKWPAGAHGGTFGGHPVAAATGVAILRMVGDAAFLASVEAKGEHLRQRLNQLKQKHACIGDVRGLGLMNAVEFITPDGADDPETTGRVVKGLREEGILVMNCGVHGQNVRLIPPLNIEVSILDEVVEALDKVITKLA